MPETNRESWGKKEGFMPRRRNLEIEQAVIADYALKDFEGNYVFNPEEVAEKHKVSESTLYSILRRCNIPRRLRKVSLQSVLNSEPEFIDQVIADYLAKDSDGNYLFSVAEVCKRNDIVKMWLYTFINERGVPLRNKSEEDITPEFIDKVISEYQEKKPNGTFLYSRDNICERNDISVNLLYSLIYERGVPLRNQFDDDFTPEIIDKVISEYLEKKPNGYYVYSQLDVCERNHISFHSLYRMLRDQGIPTRHKVLNWELLSDRVERNSIEHLLARVDEIVEAYNLVDNSGERVYSIISLCSMFNCINRYLYIILRIADRDLNLPINFRIGLRN